MRAVWNGITIAESDDTIVVEGNHYFPSGSVDPNMLKRSWMKSLCPWKGLASYYHIEVNGKQNANAAWFYPEPKSAAQQIKDHVAFWKGVKVQA